MASKTYFVVLPFGRDEFGDLVPLQDQAAELPSASAAKGRARSVALTKPGAVAFARSVDPSTGEFSEPEILGRYGSVPADVVRFADA